MSNKLVSVIVPVYNVAKYLSFCLDSILNQTYSNLEVICINDGSTDKSGDILKQYEELDSRVHIIKQKNAGLSAARNTGISAAKGNWITFVDSDDCIHKEFIEKLLEAANKYDCDLAISRFADFETNETIKKLIESRRINQTKRTTVNTGNEIYKLAYTENDGVTLNTAWGKLYKRNLFNKIRFPQGLIHEDEFTTYKTFILSEKVVLIDEQLYFYRSRPGSIMKKLKPEDELGVLDAFENRIMDFEKDKKLQAMAANDYLIRISGLIFLFKSTEYYQFLKHEYRKEYLRYWPLLNLRAKIERIVAFISPKLYCKIRSNL